MLSRDSQTPGHGSAGYEYGNLILNKSSSFWPTNRVKEGRFTGLSAQLPLITYWWYGSNMNAVHIMLNNSIMYILLIVWNIRNLLFMYWKMTISRIIFYLNIFSRIIQIWSVNSRQKTNKFYLLFLCLKLEYRKCTMATRIRN